MKRAEGRTLSTLIPVLVTGIQQRRVCGAEESFQLDSRDRQIQGTAMTQRAQA